MINLNKTIVRLLGSCLLCSAFTTINSKGILSNEFYGNMTCYISGDAGHSLKACYGESDCHGYISGEYQLGRTLEKGYAEIVNQGEKGGFETYTAAHTAFEVMDNDSGDYNQHAGYVCPLWTADRDGDRLGNDISKPKHDTIFIAGLECVGPWAAGTNDGRTVESLTFRSVPLAFDDHACEGVEGLKTVIFDGKAHDDVKSTIPYFMASNAFPSTLENLLFYDDAFKNLSDGNPTILGELLHNIASSSKIACRQTLKESKKLENCELNKLGNEDYRIFNYLKNKREVVPELKKGKWSEQIVGWWPQSWLYVGYKGNENDKKWCLLWTRRYVNMEKSKIIQVGHDNITVVTELYWPFNDNTWATFGNPPNYVKDKTWNDKIYLDPPKDIPNSENNNNGGLGQIGSTFLGSNNLNDTDESTSYESKSEELEEAEKMNLEPLQESEESQSNNLGETTNLEQSSNTSLQKESSESSSGSGTSVKQYSSEKQIGDTTKSASNSASTKTGYSTDVNLFLPMILSGGCVLVLKKKKIDY